MQYADVAIPTKIATRQAAFTYAITPELLPQIQIGQRVVVPFYRRELIGTVVKLRSQAPRIKGSIKEIKRLADPFPFFDANALKLAETVAQQHGATIGQVLDIAAPTPAFKTVKRLLLADAVADRQQNHNARSQRFGLYEPIAKRYQSYLKLVKRTLESGQRALLIFPSYEFAEEFKTLLTAQQFDSILIPPPSSLTDHYQAWCDAVAGKSSIVLGTRKAIFLSIPNLRLIVVDQPSEFGYKEEQYPYYYTPTVAKQKALIEGSHLVLGDSAPQLTEWHDNQEQKLSFISQQTDKIQTTIINAATNRGLLPEVLIDRLAHTIDRGERAVVFYNRKGEGRYYRCLDCETATYCPRCDTLMTVYEDNGVTLVCPQCSNRIKPPYRCEVCQSYRLGTAGLGIDSLAKIINERLPQARVATLGGKQTDLPRDYDILVSTAQLFYLPAAVKFSLIATIQIDQVLHGTDWRTNEEAYLLLSHLAERADHLVIQTTMPENPVIRAFCGHDINQLYQQEYQARQQHRYPPAYPLLRLIYADTSLDKAQQESQKLHQALVTQLPQLANDIFAPSAIGSGKRRGKYRYQITIKHRLTAELLKLIPSAWQIDPEPLDLRT